MGHISTQELIANHRIISDQVSAIQIQTILDELDRALQLNSSGGIVEFGCYAGTTSLFIRRLLDDRNQKREFHVYDSFRGLPEKTVNDESPAGQQFQAGELAISKRQFLQEFAKANLEPPQIHKAWFKDLAARDVPEQIAFAFLDGDFYESIRDSLALVRPHLTSHATIIIDDFAREALPGASKAVQEFAPELAARATVRHNMGIIRL